MGKQLPLLGVGTFQLKEEATLVPVLDSAFKMGIRLIDTAQSYKNEEIIGRNLSNLLSKHTLKRSDVYVISKLDPKYQGKLKAAESISKTIRYFDGYIDAMLIHWPGASKMKSDDPQILELRRQSWDVLEEFQREGKIGAIGVSNYTLDHLKELLTYCSSKPTIIQNEYHPKFQECELLEFCRDNNIRFMGYSPFGQGKLLSDPIICKVADKHSVPPSMVLIKWCISHNVSCIPRTSQPERISENFGLLGNLELDESDLEVIAGLNDGTKYCWDPRRVI